MSFSDDLFTTFSAAQERFAYFMLAAAGAAIAFALARTEGQVAAPWMAPMGLAVVCWGASFFFGVHYVLHRTRLLSLNLQRQRIVEGRVDLPGQQPALAAQGMVKQIDERAEQRIAESLNFGRYQFFLFFAGAVAYVLGHAWRVVSA